MATHGIADTMQPLEGPGCTAQPFNTLHRDRAEPMSPEEGTHRLYPPTKKEVRWPPRPLLRDRKWERRERGGIIADSRPQQFRNETTDLETDLGPGMV